MGGGGSDLRLIVVGKIEVVSLFPCAHVNVSEKVGKEKNAGLNLVDSL